MITLITGTPGSGKTLYAVTKILEYVEQNKKLLEEGKEPRLIYADIDGLDIPHAIPPIQPAPKDWRDTPDGSIIFYDEVQQREEFKKSRYDNQICDDLQIHRHTGHDLFAMTQFPSLLHPNFKAVVGLHQHLHRGWGLSSATVFCWAYCVDHPNAPSNKKIAEHTSRFAYPKSAYKYYKSATVHTHVARIPKRMFVIVFVLLILAYFAFNLLFAKDNFFKTLYAKDKTEQAQTKTATTDNKKTLSLDITDNAKQPKILQGKETMDQMPTTSPQTITDNRQAHEIAIANRRLELIKQDLPQDYQIRRTNPMLQIRGVIQMGDSCQAYNAYGDVMTLSKAECKKYVGTGKVYRSATEQTQDIPQSQDLPMPVS